MSIKVGPSSSASSVGTYFLQLQGLLVTKEVPATSAKYTPITIIVTAPPNKGAPYF